MSAGQLKLRIERILPRSARVETGQENAYRQSSEIRDDLGFLQIALLVFAGVALFVGAFLIFNTFSITVAQRVREFGMLRTLGASRGQILGSVVLEALLIGIAGSLAGLLGGIGFAEGIKALFDAIGIGLPAKPPVLETRTIVVSLVIGILVTLVSSLGPAMRSTRVPPMAALRELELPRSRRRSAALRGARRAARPRRCGDGAGRPLRRNRGLRQRGRPDGRGRGRGRLRASRSSARAWCGRWPRSAARRSSGCAG